MILCGIFHVVYITHFPLHFIFYRGNLDCFSNSVPPPSPPLVYIPHPLLSPFPPPPFSLSLKRPKLNTLFYITIMRLRRLHMSNQDNVIICSKICSCREMQRSSAYEKNIRIYIFIYSSMDVYCKNVYER